MPPDFKPIAEAHMLPYGTEAVLLMKNGRRYLATWPLKGRAVAWWPIDTRRKSMIALYEPIGFKVTREAGAEIVFLSTRRRG